MMTLERVDGIWVRPADEATDHSVLAEQRQDIYRIGTLDLTDKVCVDLGANIGAVSVACAKAGASRIIAVEPEIHNYDVLRANADDWPAMCNDTHMCAVGSTDGYVTLHGWAGGTHTEPSTLGKCDVVQHTLESLLEYHHLTGPIAFLKVDTEGAEWPTLQATPTSILERIDHIAIEVHGPIVCPWVDSDHLDDIVHLLDTTHHVETQHEEQDLHLLHATRR